MQEMLKFSNSLSSTLTTSPQVINIRIGKFQDQSGKLLYNQPDTLKDFQKFNKTFGPSVPDQGIIQHKTEFWLTKIVKVLTFCLAIMGAVSLVPIVRLIFKQKKLKTLVTTMAPYRASTAMAAPVTGEKKHTVVCHDPWVNFLLTAITMAGIVMRFWKCLKQTHLCYGFKLNNYCSLYFYFYNIHYFLPLKIADTHGRLHQLTIENKLSIGNISLQNCITWDTLHVMW